MYDEIIVEVRAIKEALAEECGFDIRRIAEEIPGNLGKSIGFAVSASQQEQQRFLGQVLHGKLSRVGHDYIGCSGIVH